MKEGRLVLSDGNYATINLNHNGVQPFIGETDAHITVNDDTIYIETHWTEIESLILPEGLKQLELYDAFYCVLRPELTTAIPKKPFRLPKTVRFANIPIRTEISNIEHFKDNPDVTINFHHTFREFEINLPF